MPEIVRYVNTASTPGSQDGTTNTPGNSGTAAYESLSAWEAAEQTNLTTSGNTHTVYCTGTTHDSVPCEINGWILDADSFITIAGNPNDDAGAHNGVYSTGTYRLQRTGAGNALLINDTHVVVEDIIIENICNDAGNYRAISCNTNGYDFHIRRCILYQDKNGQTSPVSDGVSLGLQQGTLRFYNNLVAHYSSPSQGTGVLMADADENTTAIIYNNTFVDCYDGVSVGCRTADDPLLVKAYVKNNLFIDCQGNAILTGGTLDVEYQPGSGYNASNNADFNYSIRGKTGIGAQEGDKENVSVYFINSTGTKTEENYALYAYSKDVIEAGKDLSEDSILRFTDDINGYDRTEKYEWDIGAFAKPIVTTSQSMPVRGGIDQSTHMQSFAGRGAFSSWIVSEPSSADQMYDVPLDWWPSNAGFNVAGTGLARSDALMNDSADRFGFMFINPHQGKLKEVLWTMGDQNPSVDSTDSLYCTVESVDPDNWTPTGLIRNDPNARSNNISGKVIGDQSPFGAFTATFDPPVQIYKGDRLWIGVSFDSHNSGGSFELTANRLIDAGFGGFNFRTRQNLTGSWITEAWSSALAVLKFDEGNGILERSSDYGTFIRSFGNFGSTSYNSATGIPRSLAMRFKVPFKMRVKGFQRGIFFIGERPNTSFHIIPDSLEPQTNGEAYTLQSLASTNIISSYHGFHEPANNEAWPLGVFYFNDDVILEADTWYKFVECHEPVGRRHWYATVSSNKTNHKDDMKQLGLEPGSIEFYKSDTSGNWIFQPNQTQLLSLLYDQISIEGYFGNVHGLQSTRSR